MEFPKMSGGNFPHIDTIDVNQFKNEFDYSRYDATQMKITICAVPWDMGEAHIGNRTISGIGNVVWFGSAKKRDEWFAAIPDSECYRFETKYKELHRDLYIDVPLPFDVAAKYNYLMVEYSLFANDNSPVLYETENGVRKWFWFIREVEYMAPNTTRLHILDDAFQTWIYDVNVSGMILERGHAPMFRTKTDAYLANPVGNSKDLLTEDVNYGEATIAKSESEFVFNSGNMYALMITSADPFVDWGTKADDDWWVPGAWNVQQQGVPSYFAFAVPADNLSTFMDGINSSYPQFVQALKAIAFVSSDIVTLGNSFTFAGVTCYRVTANYMQNRLMRIRKEAFGYDDEYSDIAKLYTFPYAKIIITDEDGNWDEVHIEDTNGTLNVESTVNLVFPWLAVNAHVTGKGKTTRRNITFANVTQRNMPIQGNWYEFVHEWKIPTFGVYQNAATNNDYATHFDRKQQVTAYTNDYTSEIANADTSISNADLQIAANSAINSTSNAASALDTANVNSTNQAMQAWDAGYARDTVNNQVNAEYASAAVGAAGGVAGSIASGAMSGGAIGALGGLISGAINGATTMAQTTLAANLKTSQAETTIAYTQNKVYASNGSNSDRNTIQVNANTDNTDTQNDYIEAATANSAATAKANAGRTRDTAQSAIDNQIHQTAMNAPAEFGAWSNGDLATSRPMGLFANIVTQSDSAISAAGDEMLRYGYTFGRQWAFDGNWNIGKYFTYWKLKDFWVTNLNVPDMYMDKLRFFLFGGVTVWRNPEDIGKRSIYENFQ